MKVTPYPKPLPGFPVSEPLTVADAVRLRLVRALEFPPFGVSADPRHPNWRLEIIRCPHCGRFGVGLVPPDNPFRDDPPTVVCESCGKTLGIRLPDGTHSPFFC